MGIVSGGRRATSLAKPWQANSRPPCTPTEGADVALAEQYRKQGLNMLHEYAHYLEGDSKSVSVETGLIDMLQRMQVGKFKVFRELNDWFEEFRLYHRKDGKVVKEGTISWLPLATQS